MIIKCDQNSPFFWVILIILSNLLLLFLRQIQARLAQLFETESRCFLVNVDNVGSNQLQNIRNALRGEATVLMGKNTMMRKSIKQQMETNPALEKVLPHIRGNVGFVFTRGDLVEIRDKILANKVQAPAKAGALAPLDVTIPAQYVSISKTA